MKQLLIILTILSSIGVQAQKQDSLMIRKIFDEALVNGKSYESLRSLCKDVGSRLSGSPEAAKAVVWGEKLLKDNQFDKVWLMPVKVPHWVRGNKEAVGLHMINNSNYDVRKGNSSSGAGETQFNISKGDCMNECDKDDKCLGAEYKMDKTSTCILKSDIGTIYEDEKSSLLLKNDENMLDDSIYLGKIGYIDENDTLHEYPKSMIKYLRQYMYTN